MPPELSRLIAKKVRAFMSTAPKDDMNEYDRRMKLLFQFQKYTLSNSIESVYDIPSKFADIMDQEL